MTRHLVRACNVLIPCLDKEILLFDDDGLGVFRYVKLHSQVATFHAYSVDQTLRMPIGSAYLLADA